jgi:hypothetical protein
MDLIAIAYHALNVMQCDGGTILKVDDATIEYIGRDAFQIDKCPPKSLWVVMDWIYAHKYHIQHMALVKSGVHVFLWEASNNTLQERL